MKNKTRIEESVPQEKIHTDVKCICHNCGWEEEKGKIDCKNIICPDCGMPMWNADDPATLKLRKYIKNAIRYIMMRDFN